MTQIKDIQLVSVFREAFALMDKQKAAGVPFEERVKGLEGILRDTWPFVREWKYLCDTCNDYGLAMSTCPGDSTCGRTFPHLPHDFGTPCTCAKGRRFRPAPPPEPPEPKHFTHAGRADEQLTPVVRSKKKG